MRHLKVGFIGFLSFTAIAMAKPEIKCKSIDVTFRPFYVVEIQLFDVIHPGYYAVKVTKTLDLAGTKKQVLRKEGRGKVTAKSFFVDFSDDSGKVEGKRLSNGFLKGELQLGESTEELTCTFN